MHFCFRYLGLKITLTYKLCCWLNSWKFFMWFVLCLTFNNSAKSLSNSTFWGCFGILRTSRIQNCHWNSILSKISMRKTGKCPRQMKLRVLYFTFALVATVSTRASYDSCLVSNTILTSIDRGRIITPSRSCLLTIVSTCRPWGPCSPSSIDWKHQISCDDNSILTIKGRLQ